MSDTRPTPTLAVQVVDALWWHRAVPTGSPYCACGWRPAMYLNDTDSDRRQLVGHQVDVLIRVGLLSTDDDEVTRG